MALGTPVAAATAYSAASGTSVSPAYPAGILATDVVLLFVGQKPSTANGGTVTTPTGWTLRDELLAAGGYGTTIGIDLGNTNLRVYSWNTPVAGQTGNLAITLGVNNVSWAFMVRIPTGGGAKSYGSADGQRTTTPTSPMSIALTNGATATDFQTGDLAIWAMCIPTDTSTPNQFSAQSITATGATFATAVELNEPDSGNGNDIGGYSAYASVSSGSSTTAPTVTATLSGTLSNVRGPVVLLRVREASAPPAQTLTPTLYTNTQTFHNPTVTPGTVTLTPSLYTNDQTFYSADVTQGGATQTLTPSLYTNTQTFYSATVSASNALIPALYTNTQTFYNANVSTSNALAPSPYSNTQTFYSASITQNGGTQTLLPSLYANDQTFYSPTLAASYTLAPALLTNAQTFYSPTVAASYTLSPSLYSNTQTFYAATVTTVKTLTPSLYTNNQTFYAATVGTSNALAPSLYVNPQAFYSPTVSSPFAPGTELFPSLYVNDQAFYAPAVLPGPVELLPQGYADPGYVDVGYVGPNTYSEQIFYPATIVWDQFVEPSLYVNPQTFFSPTVYFLYPAPSEVRAGVRYGPDGIYVGTLTVGGGETIIRLRSFSERC